jgi:hypothetical protein
MWCCLVGDRFDNYFINADSFFSFMKCNLPLEIETISGLGMNPLEEGFKHRGLDGKIAPFMEYAWDFFVPRFTLVTSTLPGVVYHVDVASDREPTEEESKHLLNASINEWDECTKSLYDDLASNTNMVVVDHGEVFSAYAHLAPKGAMVKTGDIVEENQPLALSHNIGVSTEPHLHFELFQPREDLSALEALQRKDYDRRKSIPAEFYQIDSLQKHFIKVDLSTLEDYITQNLTEIFQSLRK